MHADDGELILVEQQWTSSNLQAVLTRGWARRLRSPADRRYMDATDRDVQNETARQSMFTISEVAISGCSSERLQILNEVSLLLGGETETPNPVVMRQDIAERGGTAVMEVRRVLPQRT